MGIFVKTVLALALFLSLQASPLEEFYKFKAGTSWTYKRLEDNQERKLTGTVIGEEDGKVRVDWKDPDKDGTSAVTWSVADEELAHGA